jgi:hypothetical protein
MRITLMLLLPGQAKFGNSEIARRHCRNAPHIVRGASTVACRPNRQFAAGPVAQWLEPAAHNGLVAGSSPAGPTSNIKGFHGP